MANIIVCGVSIFFSLFLFFFAKDFPVSNKVNVPSAAFFPTIISVVLLVLGIYNSVVSVINLRKERASGVLKEKIQVGKIIQLMEVILLMLLYTLLWHFHIGHFILNSILIFIPISLLISDEVEWYKSVFFTISIVMFIYLLFKFLLRVRLW